MTSHWHRDFETRSVIDLKKTGADVYAAHPTTSVWCMAYAVDDADPQLWTPGQPIPGELIEAHAFGYEAWAHNSSFETVIEKYIAGPRHGFPQFPRESTRCTLVQARAMSLPAALENLAPAIDLPISKDMSGKRVMLQMSKPRKVVFADGFDDIPFTAVRVQEMDDDGWEVYEDGHGRLVAKVRWWNDAEKLAKLFSYCQDDVRVETGIVKRLHKLKPSELELYHLDQKINWRGAKVDVELAEAAKRIVAEAKRRLDKRMQVASGYTINTCSNLNQIKAYLATQGVAAEKLTKDDIETLLDDPTLPDGAREVLHIRKEAGRSAVTKIDALLRGMSPADNRARGLLQFYAANTGRWGGRRFQPQNLRRPVESDIDTLIDVVRTGDYDYVEAMYGDPMSAVADILRGLIVAEDGHRIIAADYSAIEGRVLPWLAGEQWKLDAYAEFDASMILDDSGKPIRKGGEKQYALPDIYIKSYAETFGVAPFPKKDPRRQIGKVMELASGYEGAHGAYVRFGLEGDKLEALVGIVKAAVDDMEWFMAERKYPRTGHFLPLAHWTALKVVIDRWREAHSAIRTFWRDLEEASIQATLNPGQVFHAGRHIAFKKSGSFLLMRLPSGRHLFYPYPKVQELEMPWFEREPIWVACESEEAAKEAYGVRFVEYDLGSGKALVYEHARKQCFTYCGEPDPTRPFDIVPDKRNTRQWARLKSSGGKLANNATQATARDIMADAMPRLEAAGYPIILTVHDEVVTEVPNGHGSAEEMEAIMCDLPAWARGLPLVAEGFEDVRYRK